jgi:hypothetical protein
VSEKFSCELTINNGVAIVKFIGQMDEDMDLTKLSSISENILRFDFDEVTGINSCGIRDWIAFLEDLPSDQKIIYMRCPQIIIEQMNMVKGFLPESASIESFYGPFFCESCDNEEKVLLKPSAITNLTAPSGLPCSACQVVGLDFDALPAQYFHFLK